MKKLFHIITIVIIIKISLSSGLIGYDCGGNPESIKTISKKIGQCKIPFIPPTETQVNMQLIQLTKHDHVNAYECIIEIDLDVKHCGMFSHLGNMPGGHQIYQIGLDFRRCRDLYISGTLHISDAVRIDSLRANETTIKTVQLAGSVNQDSDCKGTPYTDRFGSYKDVIVEGIVKIFYSQYQIRLNTQTNMIELSSGVRCQHTEGTCRDVTGAQISWEITP